MSDINIRGQTINHKSPRRSSNAGAEKAIQARTFSE